VYTMAHGEKIPRLLMKKMGFHLVMSSIVGSILGVTYWYRIHLPWAENKQDYYKQLYAKKEPIRQDGMHILQQNTDDLWPQEPVRLMLDSMRSSNGTFRPKPEDKE